MASNFVGYRNLVVLANQKQTCVTGYLDKEERIGLRFGLKRLRFRDNLFKKEFDGDSSLLGWEVHAGSAPCATWSDSDPDHALRCILDRHWFAQRSAAYR